QSKIAKKDLEPIQAPARTSYSVRASRSYASYGESGVSRLCRGGPVLLVGDVLEPRDVVAVERLLHRDVHHRDGRRGAVPVLLVGRDPHRVAGADLAHRPAPQLDPPHAGEDVQRLAERMRVPGGARSRLEA